MAYMAPAGSMQSGAILFVPLEGNVCRKRSIDNETWRMRDDGHVVCDEAVTWNSGAENQKYFVAVRVDAIRAGFKAAPAKARLLKPNRRTSASSLSRDCEVDRASIALCIAATSRRT